MDGISRSEIDTVHRLKELVISQIEAFYLTESASTLGYNIWFSKDNDGKFVAQAIALKEKGKQEKGKEIKGKCDKAIKDHLAAAALKAEIELLMRAVTKDIHSQTVHPCLKGKSKIVHLGDRSAFVAQLNYYEWVPYTDIISGYPTFVASFTSEKSVVEALHKLFHEVKSRKIGWIAA
ncbi:hypothetical protein SLS59_009895 [Nothophoma quercina]|uniref:Uncharacterized protein n=1 Tax=Nothophoma quercina TaxID=749835 RepID=A0ABR3QIZ6_9PLEO